jgi:pimeloyl-ACP methyl ester carboxylesterase
VADGIVPRRVPEASEHTATLGDQPVFWRSGDSRSGTSDAPVLYLHGVPDSSDQWVPFLQRTGGLAPDLPGFGRSGKSGGNDYTIEGYADFLERFFDHVGVGRVRLLVHDWGAVGLAFAQRHPERVERLVIMNAVTFLPGYKWHRIARIWRTRLVGELFMGATTRFGFRQSSREANATPGPMPDEFLDTVLDHFDEGTQRAILRLYRAADEDVLARAGQDLGRIECPSLIAWGDHDAYLPTSFAHAYAEALPNATVRISEGAGHWPWLQDPELVGEVARLLSR